jgi:hypothetical protein
MRGDGRRCAGSPSVLPRSGRVLRSVRPLHPTGVRRHTLNAPVRKRCAALAAILPFILPAAALAAAPAGPLPALVRLTLADGRVVAETDPGEDGLAWSVRYDADERSWSVPAPLPRPAGAASAPRLDQVLVFNGGLFDLHPDHPTIDLGGGFTIARSDSGYALIEDGVNRGWPVVTIEDVEDWGSEVRLGLPEDFPEDRLYQLHATGALRNVPGPVMRAGDVLWFGLAGGFTGSEGQLGGLVAYDTKTKSFRVVRHKFLVDVSVTRLLAVGDEVWIGTGRFGARSLQGLRGMLVHRPKRREWRQFSTENSRIAGDVVYDAAADGRRVWVTTDGGISRYDLDRKLWTSWYWHPLPPADAPADSAAAAALPPSLGFVLQRDRPVDLADQLIK